MTSLFGAWKIPEVRAARLTQHSCTVSVNGGLPRVHSSVHEAFRFYGLPDEKAIRFRKKVKDNLTDVFVKDEVTYTFVLIEYVDVRNCRRKAAQ